jgi:hypothetical protein
MPWLSNPHPVVSLRSTTGYTLGCLRHSFEELTNDLSLYSGPPRSDGTQVGKNRNSSIVGYYDPRTNKTKNRNSSIVGEGNLLASLIVSAR